MHELLASARRREVVAYLCARPEEPVPLDELVEHLLAVGDAADRERVLVSLHHVHLPKLAEAAVITYGDDRECVYYRVHDGLERLLRRGGSFPSAGGEQ